MRRANAGGPFEEHHLALFRFLRRMTGDAALAEDLLRQFGGEIAESGLHPGVYSKNGLVGVVFHSFFADHTMSLILTAAPAN